MVWNARIWSRGVYLGVFRIFSFLIPERGMKSLAMCLSFHLVDILSLNIVLGISESFDSFG